MEETHKITTDAAKGLEYLHGKILPAVVYRNIGRGDIFLFEGYTAKVGNIELQHHL
jgi:hypothetical protein